MIWVKVVDKKREKQGSENKNIVQIGLLLGIARRFLEWED
jgi:hypothetical protein